MSTFWRWWGRLAILLAVACAGCVAIDVMHGLWGLMAFQLVMIPANLANARFCRGRSRACSPSA